MSKHALRPKVHHGDKAEGAPVVIEIRLKPGTSDTVVTELTERFLQIAGYNLASSGIQQNPSVEPSNTNSPNQVIGDL